MGNSIRAGLLAGILGWAPLAASPRARVDWTWEQLARLIATQQYEMRLRDREVAASGLRVTAGELAFEAKDGAARAPVADLLRLRDGRGQRARIEIGGARLEATLLEAQPQALAVWVLKTTDKARYPKGLALLPREQVPNLELISAKGRAPLVGALVGLGVGAGFGAAIGAATPEEGYGIVIVPAAAAAVAVVGTVSGYATGRALRWRTTEVRIVTGP